jgi:hypothetical protein
MQRTSRTPPVIAIGGIEANVVRLQRRPLEPRDEETSRPDEVAALSALMERASDAARQIRYFGLATKQFSLNELASSARRAGFVQVGVNPQQEEISFQWASGQPDLVFSVSFLDPARIAITAESQADVSGLILTACSHVPTVSVEVNPALQDTDLGHNAVLFRDMLLTFPGFDDTPAWAKYPEGYIPEAGGLVEMWRKGSSITSVFGQTWNSLSPRLCTVLERLRDRWSALR